MGKEGGGERREGKDGGGGGGGERKRAIWKRLRRPGGGSRGWEVTKVNRILGWSEEGWGRARSGGCECHGNSMQCVLVANMSTSAGGFATLEGFEGFAERRSVSLA